MPACSGPWVIVLCCLSHLPGLVFCPWRFPVLLLLQHPVIFFLPLFAAKPIAFLNVMFWLPSFSLDASVYFVSIRLKIDSQASLIFSRNWTPVYRLSISLGSFCSFETLYSSWKFPIRGKRNISTGLDRVNSPCTDNIWGSRVNKGSLSPGVDFPFTNCGSWNE